MTITAQKVKDLPPSSSCSPGGGGSGRSIEHPEDSEEVGTAANGSLT